MSAPPPPPPNRSNGMPPPAMPPPGRSNKPAGMPPPGRNVAPAAAQPGMPPPPPSAGPKLEGRDLVLLEMQKAIYDFYARNAPEKIVKEVIIIALQLWWDTGLSGLNQVLMSKYGKIIELQTDILDDFDRDGVDVTMLVKPDLNASAAKKHLIVKAMKKTNSAEYFQNDVKRDAMSMRRSVNKGMKYAELLQQEGMLNKSFSFNPSQPATISDVPPLSPQKKPSRGRSSKKSKDEIRRSKSKKKHKKKHKKHKRKHKKKKKKHYSSSDSSDSSDDSESSSSSDSE